MGKRGRPKKKGNNRNDYRNAYILTSVAFLIETGEAKNINHACQKLARRMLPAEQDLHKHHRYFQYQKEKGTNRELWELLRDDHKNAKRCPEALAISKFAWLTVKSRSPFATKANAAAWLLNCLDFIDEETSKSHKVLV